MTRRVRPLTDRPRFEPGARVRIAEPGLTPWVGVVTAVKPSSVSGWWVEVRRDEVGTYAMTDDLPEGT